MKYFLFLMAATNRNKLVYTQWDYSVNRIMRIAFRVLALPEGLFRYFFPRKCPGREGLAFVLIAKNEAPYIEEWINFHVKQGVTHFIIYDNESTDNFREVLRPYIASGLVTYHAINGKKRQLDVYNMALHDYGDKFRYMGFIDTDEFVFVRNLRGGGISSLCTFLDEFMTSHPNAGGIGVNWCMFGSNGHITKPEGGVLENYTMRAEDNFGGHHAIKTICDPMKVLGFTNVHFPIYCRGFCNMNEAGDVVEGSGTKAVSFSRIRINHYYTKSKEEFMQKRDKGRADSLVMRSMTEFDKNDQNVIRDVEILSCV
mgnify:CR=1 FL=1